MEWPTPKDQLKFFLHCGNVEPKYTACYTLDESKLFTLERVSSCVIDRVKSTEVEATTLLEEIRQVALNETSVIPEAALYALAVIVRKACRCMIQKDDKRHPDYKHKGKSVEKASDEKEVQQDIDEPKAPEPETAGLETSEPTASKPTDSKPKAPVPTAPKVIRPKKSRKKKKTVEPLASDKEGEQLNTDKPEAAKSTGSKKWTRKKEIEKLPEELTEKEKKRLEAKIKAKKNAHACHRIIRDAYKLAREIVEKSNNFDYFFMFTNYLREIAKLENKRGFGEGWRRCVDRLYNRKDPLDLAEEVTKLNDSLKWSHKKVLRNHYPDIYDGVYTPRRRMDASEGELSDPDASEDELLSRDANEETADAKDAVLLYMKLSWDKVRETYGSSTNATVRNVVYYLQNIRRVRTTKDKHDVEDAIKTCKLKIQQIPPSHLDDAKMWVILMPTTDPKYLLEIIHSISKRKLFRLQGVVDSFTERMQYLTVNAIHPAQVFTIHRRYREAPLRKLHFQRVQQSKKLKQQDEKLNPPVTSLDRANVTRGNLEIEACLRNVFMKTLTGLTATGKRYVIAVDFMATNDAGRICSAECFVRIQEAAALITLCILKAEPAGMVKLVYFGSHAGPRIRSIDLGNSLVDVEFLGVKFSQQIHIGRGIVSELLSWGTESKQDCDVFIVLGDTKLKARGYAPMETPYEQLERYQENMRKNNGKTDARLITCCLNGKPPEDTELMLMHKNMLLICGFDIRVVSLIENFSRGLF